MKKKTKYQLSGGGGEVPRFPIYSLVTPISPCTLVRLAVDGGLVALNNLLDYAADLVNARVYSGLLGGGE